jgi:hypothetical protein
MRAQVEAGGTSDRRAWSPPFLGASVAAFDPIGTVTSVRRNVWRDQLRVAADPGTLNLTHAALWIWPD